MVYSIDNEVVFGTNFDIPFEGIHDFRDIFGNSVTIQDVIVEYNERKNKSSPLDCFQKKLSHNIMIGQIITRLWVEYLFTNSLIELGTSNASILLLLSNGFLAKASNEFLQVGTLEGFNSELMERFSLACLSSNVLREG